MGSAATLFAGAMLWIPYSRRCFSLRAEIKQQISNEAAADAAFEAVSMANWVSTSLAPITVETPAVLVGLLLSLTRLFFKVF